MKKILILLICYKMLLGNSRYELKLYESILPSIFSQTPLKIYASDDLREFLQYSSKFIIMPNCTDAVVILVGRNFKHISKECKNKPLFATSYRWFKTYQNSFGAFYWRKGRPQIKFKQSVLHKYNLNLPKSMEKYAK